MWKFYVYGLFFKITISAEFLRDQCELVLTALILVVLKYEYLNAD